jgi:hypothetical protein
LAITHLLRKRLNLAGLKAVFAKVTFDNAYAAGGLALDPTKLGLTTIFAVQPIASAQGAIPVWDFDNKKLMLFWPSGGGAVSPAAPADPGVVTTPDAGATNLTGSAAKPALAGVVTPGRGKEFAAASDASTITVEVLVYGN